MFLLNSFFDIASYANYNTPYISGPNKDFEKIEELKICSAYFFKWFRENHMKSNLVKYHLLLSSRNPFQVNIEGHIMYEGEEEKPLEFKIDSQLLFESHMSILFKKSSQKLHSIWRITNYIDLEKWKCLMSIYNILV